MSRYNLKYNYRDAPSCSSKSPLPFVSRSDSPAVNPVFPRSRQYKSPDSTPTTSPAPSKVVSYEEVLQCFSDKKAKDQNFHLKQKIAIQDKRIQLLEEENKRLANMKKPEYWEKELLKRNADLRKLENQVRYYMELATENNDLDKIKENIEQKNKRIEELELELGEYEKKFVEMEKQYRKVVCENEEILKSQKNLLRKDECELLLRQIQELEAALELQAKQSNILKDENEKLKKDMTPGTLNYFAHDINKIKVEMSKLAKIVEEFANGKEITLKGLLGFENSVKVEPIRQISNDVVSIKGDLSKVLTIISDFHAEQFANIACRTQ